MKKRAKVLGGSIPQALKQGQSMMSAYDEQKKSADRMYVCMLFLLFVGIAVMMLLAD
jgi:hypothetical protein